MGKRQRASWDGESLTLIEDALNDIGANEDCAKFLIESIGPSIGPRMILNAAMRIIEEKGPPKVNDPSFEKYLSESHVEWTRNKYYAQTSINGEQYAGITVIRRILQRLTINFTREQFSRVGLSNPLPKARRLDDWIRRKAGIKSRMLNGARLYSARAVAAYIEEINGPCQKAAMPKNVPTSVAVASVLVEPASDSGTATPQQLSLPETMTTSDPKIITLGEAMASAAAPADEGKRGIVAPSKHEAAAVIEHLRARVEKVIALREAAAPAVEGDEDAVIRRAAQSKHRKLAAAVQVAEVEERMAYDAYAKASNAHHAANKALTDFETQMAEYLAR